MPRRAFQVLVGFGVFAAPLLLLRRRRLRRGGGVGEASGHGKSWFELFKTTGIVGILLLTCSMIGTALLIQYMMTINASKLRNPELLAEVENLLNEGNLEEAFALAEADTTYTGKVLAGALSRSTAGYEEARKGLEEAAMVESFRLNAKLSYLSLIGNIGPLLGLLGTVTGMITSFQKIETMKAPTPADLAVGRVRVAREHDDRALHRDHLPLRLLLHEEQGLGHHAQDQQRDQRHPLADHGVRCRE